MCFLREFAPKIHLPPLLKSIAIIGKRFLDFGVKCRIKLRREYAQHYKIAVGGFPSAYKVLGLVENRINGVPFGFLSFAEIGHTMIIIIKKRS